ncbi:MAG: hypothetical protein ACI4CS_03895 [Candidatus Weimeria sp.]
MKSKTENLIINNEYLDSIYFSVINDIMPDTLLDIGMYLKRTGSVSRSAGGSEIKGQVTIDGVDVMPDIKCGIYQVIYDHIISIDDFISEVTSGAFDKKYDLAIAFDLCEFINDYQSEIIISSLIKNCRSILLDKASFEKALEYTPSKEFQIVSNNGAEAYLIY